MTESHNHDPFRRKERVARWSIVASGVLAVAKFAAGIISGSLALLSEAVHALVDTVATMVTWWAVKVANKPADEKHQYGHAKAESIAALIETGVLFLLAVVVLVQAVRRLLAGGGEIETSALLFVVLVVSILVDFNRIRVLNRVARETESHALAADALHFTSDMAGSIIVLLGLLASWWGFRYGDALAALGVAGFIGIAGYRLGKRTLDSLLDEAPAGRTERIRQLVTEIPRVIVVHGLRLRRTGSEVLGEINLDVARTLTLEQVSAIKEQVRVVIQKEFPDTKLTVITHPRVLATETVQERIMLLALRRKLPVHHVIVQNLEERLSVSLDLEVDEHMSMGEAHQIASTLEEMIRDEFGPETEVETHIEPQSPSMVNGTNENPLLVKQIQVALAELVQRSGGIISDVHDVRVRRNEGGLIVNYHCRVAPALNVALVHSCVDNIEHALRQQFSDIMHVIGHTDVRE